ncbi:MAG: hypothetical protein MI974_20080 [Chitinophagales bacterium]|nr:hypothetical protein [Chitinophagales bacterium]
MKSSRIQVRITSNELSEATKEEMWKVYKKYYHYERSYFMNRINQNNYFSFYRIDDKIVGFTGLRINRTSVGHREYLLIYFGQTIIDHAYRGNALIPRTAVQLCLKYWKDIILGRVYVWADALTYKAYLVFAKTLHEYYPTYRKQAPAHISKLIQFVGEEYYGNNFCPRSGTVRKKSVLVKDQTTLHTPGNTYDKDILYYKLANRNNDKGYGLITIAPIHFLNYLMMAAKCLKKIAMPKRKKYPIPTVPSTHSPLTL